MGYADRQDLGQFMDSMHAVFLRTLGLLRAPGQSDSSSDTIVL